MPLSIKIGQQEWLLEAGRYDLTDGRISVPLGELAAHMGGVLRWNGGERAYVWFGTRSVEYHLGEKSITEYDPMKGFSERPLARMQLVDGEIRVALRLAVVMLGGEITGYAMDEREISVNIDRQRKPIYFFANLQ